jgi:hypothetical protein
VLNGANRSVTADIVFDSEVWVSDLASEMKPASTSAEARSQGTRFALEVPSCGILSLAVEGLNMEATEAHMAMQMAEETRESALRATEGELTGYDPDSTQEAPWN